jgi:hypothetical protein
MVQLVAGLLADTACTVGVAAEHRPTLVCRVPRRRRSVGGAWRLVLGLGLGVTGHLPDLQGRTLALGTALPSPRPRPSAPKPQATAQRSQAPDHGPGTALPPGQGRAGQGAGQGRAPSDACMSPSLVGHLDGMRARAAPDGLPPALHDGHLLPALHQATPLELMDRPAPRVERRVAEGVWVAQLASGAALGPLEGVWLTRPPRLAAAAPPPASHARREHCWLPHASH